MGPIPGRRAVQASQNPRRLRNAHHALTVAVAAGIAVFAVAAQAAPPDSSSSPAAPATTAGERELHDYADLLKKMADSAKDASQQEAKQIETTLTTLQSAVTTLDRASDWFKWLTTAVGAMLVVMGGVFGWLMVFFNRSTKPDIVAEVGNQLRTKVEVEMQAKTDKVLADHTNFLRAQQEGELQKMRENLQKKQDEFNQAIQTSVSELNKKALELNDLFQETRPVVAERAARVAKTTGSLQDKSLIWVDDQPNTIAAAKEQLESKGIIVETVEDSDKLDRRLREKKFDLVVSDLRREGSPRAGLDYFIRLQKLSRLPPSLLFAPKTLVDPVRPEIDDLSHAAPDFLGAVTTTEQFFAVVYDWLGRSAPKATPISP